MERERPISAVYANLFRVGYNDSEFVVEFCQSYSGDVATDNAPTVVARVVVTPAGAQDLNALLRDSLEHHARLVARHSKRGGAA